MEGFAFAQSSGGCSNRFQGRLQGSIRRKPLLFFISTVLQRRQRRVFGRTQLLQQGVEGQARADADG